MDPFELFDSAGVYKLAILYFSSSRGLAIVGRHTTEGNVEIIQISGEVDPHTGNFTALDYPVSDREEDFPVISQGDFENLVAFIEAKIDGHTHMSVIEPELMRTALSHASFHESPSRLIH